MHRNKEIILHFSIQILFIKFKSPRFVRIRAFFFTPKSSQQVNESTSQQANEPTSFRRSDEAGGSAWVCYGSVWVRRVRLMVRFNPLKTQLTPIFNEYNHPTHSHRFFEKKSHRFNRFNKTNRNGMSLVAPH